MKIEIEIDKMIEALDNKMLECDYKFKTEFQYYLEKKYLGFLNKYIFKKSFEKIKEENIIKILKLSYSTEFNELSYIKRYFILKVNYDNKKDDLIKLKKIGLKQIEITKSDVDFLILYANDSKHVKLIKEKYKDLKDLYLIEYGAQTNEN